MFAIHPPAFASWLALVVVIAFPSLVGEGSREGRSSAGETTGLALMVVDPLVGIGGSTSAVVGLAAPAPTGGVLVSLSSADPGIATITPTTVTIPAGAMTSTDVITVTGVSVGAVLLMADAPGCVQAVDMVTVTDQLISLGAEVAVVPSQSAGLPLSLTVPAPAGGLRPPSPRDSWVGLPHLPDDLCGNIASTLRRP